MLGRRPSGYPGVECMFLGLVQMLSVIMIGSKTLVIFIVLFFKGVTGTSYLIP